MAARKSLLHPAPARPDLEKLLEEARTNPPSEEQLRTQRVSFAYGNAPADATRITKDTVLDSARRVRVE